MRDSDPTTTDSPVEAALAVYFLRRDRGESVDLSEFIAAYPECDEELREFLAKERRINRAMTAVLPIAPSQDLTGRTFGDFRLLRLIGRGGMGVVWEAEQQSLGRKVAVKLLPSALCSDPRHRTRFQNEARILAQLAHPNIVSVIAVGEEADTYYFVMQYVAGVTADDLIRLWGEEKPAHDAETDVDAIRCGDTEDSLKQENGHPREQTPHWIAALPNRAERYRKCARIASEIADGLAHAHACGVLHRDVKPSNILLDHSGTSRLSDFGLARMYGDATLTATGTILGTLRYASPEQLGSTQVGVDERSDIYSLGATLWELVTGKRLFSAGDHNSVINHVLKVEAPRPSSLAPGLPRDLETIIARAMAKEPADRYPSAQVFADDLRRFLDGRPIQAKPISLGERAFRWANRNRALTTAAVGALVILTAVAISASGLILSANSRTATALTASRDSEAKARESERRTRELLYAADMTLAGAAWHKNEPAQVRMILDRYAQPKTGGDSSVEEDPRGFEWYFLDRQIRPQSELLFQNDKALYLIEFMPNGDQFFTGGQDSVVRWHDSDNGKVMRSLDTHQTEINCVSYNPSRTIFATAGDDGTVKIWNAANLSMIREIKAIDGKCLWAKFRNDDLIVTGGESKVHRLYDVATGDMVREFASPEAKSLPDSYGESWHAHVGNGGDRLWTIQNCDAGVCQGVYEWDIRTGAPRRILKIAGLVNVLADSLHSFLFVMTHKEVRILDATTGNERQLLRLESGMLETLALSPDERLLLAGDQTGQIHVWNLDLSKPTEIPAAETLGKFSIHGRDVNGITFAPDGETIFSVGRDGSVRRTTLRSPRVAGRELLGLRGQQCLPIPGTDHVLVFANAPLSVLEPATGKIIQRISRSHYRAASVSSDGTLIAAARKNHLGVWNLSTGKLVLNLKPERMLARSLGFSPDNSKIVGVAIDDADQGIEVVDVAMGTIEKFFSPSRQLGWTYFCVSDGLVAWLSTSGQLVCWNRQDKSVRWETEPVEMRCTWTAAISPDQKSQLVIEGRVLTLIDCATGDVRYRTPCEHSVNSLAFSRDGRSFFVGGDQGQLSIWHARLGQQMVEIANVGTAIESIQPLDNGFLASTWRITDGRKELVWYEYSTSATP